jgi:hypothetical protein
MSRLAARLTGADDPAGNATARIPCTGRPVSSAYSSHMIEHLHRGVARPGDLYLEEQPSERVYAEAARPL